MTATRSGAAEAIASTISRSPSATEPPIPSRSAATRWPKLDISGLVSFRAMASARNRATGATPSPVRALGSFGAASMGPAGACGGRWWRVRHSLLRRMTRRRSPALRAASASSASAALRAAPASSALRSSLILGGLLLLAWRLPGCVVHVGVAVLLRLGAEVPRPTCQPGTNPAWCASSSVLNSTSARSSSSARSCAARRPRSLRQGAQLHS